MCRGIVKSYEINGIHNRLIVLNNQRENRIVIEREREPDNMAEIYKKFIYMRFYLCVNLVYIGYLHYKNYILWENCNP
tara:strand:- start:408 stop:641 length:234 start_codon:yes stop_codon:yes gene_type:complete